MKSFLREQYINTLAISEGAIYVLKVLFYYEFKEHQFYYKFYKLLWAASFLINFDLNGSLLSLFIKFYKNFASGYFDLEYEDHVTSNGTI